MLRKVLLLITLMICGKTCFSQTFDISLFENSGGALKSELDKNISEYRKQKKEHEKWFKDQQSEYQAIKDSLDTQVSDSTYADISKDSLAVLEKLRKESYLYTDSLYSYEEIMNWEASKKAAKKEVVYAAKNQLEENPHYQKYLSVNDDLINFRQEYKTYKDSLKNEELQDYEREYYLEKKREELAEKHSQKLESYAEAELKKSNTLNLPTDSPEMQHLQEVNELAKAASVPDEELLNSAAPTEDFFEGKTGALQQATQQTNELKEKYSQVLDASDLKSATKRNAMKGKSLRERLVLGGNFQLRIDQQTSVDVSPELQYLINKKWSAGLGGSYRANGDLVDLGNGLEETQVYGYSLLTEYFLVSSFYAHVSFESSSNGSAIPNAELQKVSTWHNSLLAGIERQFKIRGKLKGQVSILYNFMHKTNPLNDKPWNVRFGVSSTLK